MAGRHYSTGKRRDNALIQKHNGNADKYGQPTYKVEADWETVIRWPCQFQSTSGGEFLRGRQVTAQSTHVLWGDYAAVRNVTTDMRVKIRGQVLGIINVDDLFGDQKEMSIDAKRET
jgi:SPP1 family predicted phage head-tail adaptor